MLSRLVVILLFTGLCACGAEKTGKTEGKSSASSEAPAPDLSSEESASKELITALENDNKVAFFNILSPRLQKKAKECEGKDSENCKRRHSLEAMFRTWKNAFDKGEMTVDKLKEYKSLKNVDGKWSLNDS